MKHTILVLFMAIVYFTVSGCNIELKKHMTYETKTIEGFLLKEGSNEPLKLTLIKFYREKKPIMAMRYWVEIGKVTTNDEGFFTFDTNFKGKFKLEWNPGANPHPELTVINDFKGVKRLNLIHRNEYGKKTIWKKKQEVN